MSCLNALAVAADAAGGLDKIKRAVKATVYVACEDHFTQQPRVADGATDLIAQVLGPDALPARAAVGVNALPADLSVELEIVFEVKPGRATPARAPRQNRARTTG